VADKNATELIRMIDTYINPIHQSTENESIEGNIFSYRPGM
jgi:hypothetical protein